MDWLFIERADFVQLLAGLAFLVLAIACIRLRDCSGVRISRGWLAGFGFVNSAQLWGFLTASRLNQNAAWEAQAGFAFLSVLCLVEVMRRSASLRFGRGRGLWIHVLWLCPAIGLLALHAREALSDDLAEAILLNAWALPMLGVVIILWRQLRASSDRSKRAMMATACVGLTAGGTVIVLPAMAWYLHWQTGHTAGSHGEWVLLQLLQAGGIICAAILLRMDSRELLVGHRRGWDARIDWLTPALVVVLAVGWVVVEKFATVARDKLHEQANATASILRERMDGRCREVECAARMLASSTSVVRAMTTGAPQDAAVANQVLDRYRDVWGLGVCFLLDTNGKGVLPSNRESPNTSVGGDYRFRPYWQQAMQGVPAQYWAFGMRSRERSFYASCPVRGEDGRILAVAVAKHTLDPLEKGFPEQAQAYVVDPHGVVFLASNKNDVLKSLWPISPMEQMAIAETKQFGLGPFEAILPATVTDGAVLTTEAGRYMAARQLLTGKDWAVVVLMQAGLVDKYRLAGMGMTALLCVLILGIDWISEQSRLADARVLASDRRFREIMESVHLAAVNVDSGGRITFCNDHLLEVTRWTREEVIGKRWVDVFVPEDSPMRSELPAKTAAGTLETYGEYEIAARSGERRLFQWTRTTMRDLRGQMVGISSVGQDVTERRRMEQALVVREREFRSLAENIPDNIARFTLDARYTYVNWRVEECLATPASQLLGKTPTECFPGSPVAEYESRIVDVARTGVPAEIEIPVPARDGTQRWHHIRLVAERNAADEITGVLTLGRDITDRKRAEEDRLAHLRFLESMDRVSRAMQGAGDIEKMMSDVLDIVLDTFQCDRAWLLYPCDPNATAWHIPMECTRPEYPGALAAGLDIPMDTDKARVCQLVLDADGPVAFGIGSEHPLPTAAATQFGYKAKLAMAIWPRSDNPYMFGLHQCSRPRIWTAAEKSLFQDFGWRLGDALTSLLAYRRLQESEARFRSISMAAQDGIIMMDHQGRISVWNKAASEMFGYSDEEAIGQSLHAMLAPERFHAAHHAAFPKFLQTGHGAAIGKIVELVGRRRDGSEFPLELSVAPVRVGENWHAVGILRDISQRKAMEDELRAAARMDRLTKLPNRALLLDRLQNAIGRHSRSADAKYAVLFLDFDRFKLVNDSLGHEVGDQLLCAIAGRLRHAVRAVDSVSCEVEGSTAARLGGDEFVILLDGLRAPEDAVVVAQRLLSVLSEPFKLGAHEVVSAASIGIVTSEFGHATAEDVLRDADTAMYEAKLAGKGRAVMFDDTMRQRVRRKVELENGLRKALELGQFLLHYQPIVSLETGAVESLEALVRWQHPELGHISPGEFVPIAEETGLIVPIGEWVFREACRQLGVWWRTLGREASPSVSINLSRNQLGQPHLPQRLGEIAREAGVEPSAIHLEVTESAITSDTKLATELLRQMKEIGFKVDMDDFGTGYSSLASLHQFPIDVLKIDRSFVVNLDRGSDFAALVNAIIMLARNLHVDVIAEGVELADQVSLLQAMDCRLAQGYFFARPMPADEVAEYLRKRLAA